MKKNIIKVILILILINITSAVFAKIENKIILKIENEIITNYEIKNKILRSLVLSGQAISQDNINRFKSQAWISRTIKNKIEFKNMIFQNETQINAYLNSISSNNILSLKEKFKLNNLSYELFLEEIEIESKWQNLFSNLFK